MLVGTLFGLGVVAADRINTSTDESGMAKTVGAAVLVTGLIAFAAGHRTVASAENARFNQGVRDAHQRARAEAMARAVERAPVRIRLEGGAP